MHWPLSLRMSLLPLQNHRSEPSQTTLKQEKKLGQGTRLLSKQSAEAGCTATEEGDQGPQQSSPQLTEDRVYGTYSFKRQTTPRFLSASQQVRADHDRIILTHGGTCCNPSTGDAGEREPMNKLKAGYTTWIHHLKGNKTQEKTFLDSWHTGCSHRFHRTTWISVLRMVRASHLECRGPDWRPRARKQSGQETADSKQRDPEPLSQYLVAADMTPSDVPFWEQLT